MNTDKLDRIALEVARRKKLPNLLDSEAVELVREVVARLQQEAEPFGEYSHGKLSVAIAGGPDAWRERKAYNGPLYAFPPAQPAQSADRKLYDAANAVMARLGADGEIASDDESVSALMNVLHDIDGGVYRPAQSATPFAYRVIGKSTGIVHWWTASDGEVTAVYPPEFYDITPLAIVPASEQPAQSAEAGSNKPTCPHCGTTDVSFERTCHNSACGSYANAETIYEGWRVAAAAPARPVGDTFVGSVCYSGGGGGVGVPGEGGGGGGKSPYVAYRSGEIICIAGGGAGERPVGGEGE